ncbi:MAG: hypothetical protein OXT65_02885 [Alphaproteobacteria bacterium]|nr:hypothetical protein [Alphaproteobacteria bacterium]
MSAGDVTPGKGAQEIIGNKADAVVRPDSQMPDVVKAIAPGTQFTFEVSDGPSAPKPVEPAPPTASAPRATVKADKPKI